jgi:2,5-furandicarboxylate decarboxylase 1
MVFKDFRDYLDNLERNGLLVKVNRPVHPRFEIAAGIRKISDTNGPALLFENVTGYPGWRVAAGLFATPRLMAFALQTEESEEKILGRYLEFDQQRINPILVSSGSVKEVIIKEDDIDLAKLPIATYCEMDAGPYLTSGVEMARDPVTGIQNASIHRRRVLGKDKTSVLAAGAQHLGLMIQAAEEKGQGLEIATVIGAHPALTIASQAKAPLGVDEMEIAGALRGVPFEVVRCETIDVQVPADAEMVIEGVTIPGERAVDGPFGEFPGNYISMGDFLTASGRTTFDSPVIKVTAITMRKNAIFQAMLTGMPLTENHYLKKWAVAAAICRRIAHTVPYPEDIRGVNLAGQASHSAVISIHKRAESTPRDIIHTVLAAGLVFGLVVVVDEDINIYDPAEVEWAVATRVIPSRDIIIRQGLPPVPGSTTPPVDTSVYKWGIDATTPVTREPWQYRRAVPPGVNEVDYV